MLSSLGKCAQDGQDLGALSNLFRVSPTPITPIHTPMRDRVNVNTNTMADIRSRLVTISSLSRGDTIMWHDWQRLPRWGMFLGTTKHHTDGIAIVLIQVAPANPVWDSVIDVYPDTLIQRVMNPNVLPHDTDKK